MEEQYTVRVEIPVVATLPADVVPVKELVLSVKVTVTEAALYSALSSDFSVAVIVKSKFIEGVLVLETNVIE